MDVFRPTAIDLAFDYVKANYDQVVKKYIQDGGWEPWFQNELVDFIKERGVGDQRYAEREYHIWTGPKKAEKVDILTNYRINHQGFIEAIELKCASTRQDEKAGDLARRMRDDIQKLIDGKSNLDPLMLADNKRFYGVSIGITLDSASTEETERLLAIAPGADLITRLDWGPADGSGRTVTIWAYWLYINLQKRPM